ncbi:histidinol-phosphate transaminase [Bacillus horti]|uniref:histidinol-phosphate transaminase n=1 Tax=Caldalkalibacillus horti TaxID=77523 RepID=UPI00352261A2
MKAKAQISGLAVYQPGKPISQVKRELQLDTIIKLASNENPYGASPKVQDALVQEAANLASYPEGDGYQIREELAEFYGVEKNQIIFGNGSDEIISFITRAYLDSNSNTVMATPTFSVYKTNAAIEGAEVIEVPLKDGTHDLAEMKKAITEQTKVVWVCNPNNPSGTYVKDSELKSFLQAVPNDILIVLDEAYYEYVTGQEYPDSLTYLQEFPNVLVLRTFSKIYGLASLRIGYGIGAAEVIDALNRVRGPFNTNRMAQAAALAALGDQEYVEDCCKLNQFGKEQFYEALKEMQLFYYPTEGNFILIDVQRKGNEAFDYLLRQGIIVRSGEALGFPTFIRVTIGTKEQNEKVIEALKQMVRVLS